MEIALLFFGRKITSDKNWWKTEESSCCLPSSMWNEVQVKCYSPNQLLFSWKECFEETLCASNCLQYCKSKHQTCVLYPFFRVLHSNWFSIRRTSRNAKQIKSEWKMSCRFAMHTELILRLKASIESTVYSETRGKLLLKRKTWPNREVNAVIYSIEMHLYNGV